jgi:hypothetical protein
MRVAMPRARGAVVARGELAVDAPPAAATRVGEARVTLAPGQARTLLLRWTDAELGEQQNFVHLHCPAPGEHHGPGLTVVE